MVSDGRFHDVPYVVGVVAYESKFFMSKLATIVFVYPVTLVLSRLMGLNVILKKTQTADACQNNKIYRTSREMCAATNQTITERRRRHFLNIRRHVVNGTHSLTNTRTHANR